MLLASSPAAATERAADLVIRGGLVLTMEPGDAPRFGTDVLIRDGKIAAVGTALDVPPDTRTVDAAGKIVMPGFVNAHDHLSITIQRGLYGNTADTRFFPTANRLGPLYAPDDTYAAFLAGAVEGLSAGFTTVADFFDNALGPDHADAAVRALQDAGVRARLHYGARSKTTQASIDLDDVARLDDALPENGLVQVGLAWRLPADLDDGEAWAVKNREWAFAAARDLPVQVHVSSQTPGGAAAMFDRLIADGRLGRRVAVIHGTDATPAHLAALNAAGAGLVLTPQTEHRVGYGLTRMSRFASVARLGLGVDGPALAGIADPFAAMRLLALTEAGASRDETSASTYALLETATLGGARALGLDDRIGSLTPGKAADILIVAPGSPNLAGALPQDPSALLVYSARPSDIETVLVAGRIVKERGRMTAHDPDELAAAARRAIKAVLRRR